MKVSGSIPFLDLVTPHVELEAELTTVFQQALRTAGFIGGPMVEDFERSFAAFCNTEYSVASLQRNRCAAPCSDGVRRTFRGRRSDRAAHLHRHHRGDFASWSSPGVRRHR